MVRNICSDAMLKLIGAHCTMLQYLVVANSKQVTDIGVESLCCQVTILGRLRRAECRLDLFYCR